MGFGVRVRVWVRVRAGDRVRVRTCTGKRPPPHAAGSRSRPAGPLGWNTPSSWRVFTLNRKSKEVCKVG